MLNEEFVCPLAMSQSELARRLGVSRSRLGRIVRGKTGVTAADALRLSRVWGMSPDFWLGLQQDWDLWHAMQGERAADIARLTPIPGSG